MSAAGAGLLPAATGSSAADGDGLPPGVAVRGGAGGTRARLEDLTGAAARLDAVHEALADAVRQVERLADGIDDAALWSPGTAPGALRALREASPASVRRAAQRAADLADDLRAAVRVYDGADEAVRGVLSRWFDVVQGMAGRAFGEAGPVAWVGAGLVAVGAAGMALSQVVGLRLMSRTPTPAGLVLGAAGRWLAGRPGLAGEAGRLVSGPGLLPGVPGLARLRASGVDMDVLQGAMPFVASAALAALPGRAPFSAHPVRDAAAAAIGAGTLAGAVLGTAAPVLMVAPVIGKHREKEKPPQDASDLLALVAASYPPDGAPGSVAVTRLDQPGERTGWVVAVPGTQSGNPLPGGSNPSDVRSDFVSASGGRADALRVVVEAMTQAGVQPGDSVVVVGHSLGGMVGADFVADPRLQARFDVDVLLTAGSPVGDRDLPAEVAALHLEHEQDPVPATDGVPNPDTRSRTTVTRDLGRSSTLVVPDRLNVPDAHGIDAYVETAGLVQDVDDRSVAAFRAALGEALRSPDAVATTTLYQGIRMPQAAGAGRP